MDYYFSKRISGLAPSAIREILKATQNPDIIPLAAGNPDVATFPMKEVKKMYERPSMNRILVQIEDGFIAASGDEIKASQTTVSIEEQKGEDAFTVTGWE